MRKFTILFILILFSLCPRVKSQNSFIGKTQNYSFENGVLKTQTIVTPALNPGGSPLNYENTGSPFLNRLNNSIIRWSFTDPIAIGDRVAVSGNGNYNVTGWDLNTKRISLYNNNSPTPLWEFMANANVNMNYVAISDTGGIIAAGSYQNIYLFNNTDNTPFFNFDLTTRPDTGIAGPVAITKNGNFLIGCASRNDSSVILGFNKNSTVSVWKSTIKPIYTPSFGAEIQGIKMSGNDSLVIVNMYNDYFVFRTFTGELLFRGAVNTSSTSGTQSPQGISGNGNIIATIDYSGWLRVYQWNGTIYALLWQNQEPPGIYYNWMTSVDISYDGKYIAAGTLNFVSSSVADGKIKVFETTSGGTPKWVYLGCGDEVQTVSFSKNGNILAAVTWGPPDNQKDDLFIFKTAFGNVPFFTVNTPGSLYWCSTSSDGSTVAACGKRIHARAFGNGGLLYNIFVDTNDVPTGIVNTSEIPKEFKLWQNYPNPFNPTTNIEYVIPKDCFVSLKIYDVLGKEIADIVNMNQRAGTHSALFSLDDYKLSSGIYFYRLQSGDFTDIKKMTVIK